MFSDSAVVEPRTAEPASAEARSLVWEKTELRKFAWMLELGHLCLGLKRHPQKGGTHTEPLLGPQNLEAKPTALRISSHRSRLSCCVSKRFAGPGVGREVVYLLPSQSSSGTSGRWEPPLSLGPRAGSRRGWQQGRLAATWLPSEAEVRSSHSQSPQQCLLHRTSRTSLTLQRAWSQNLQPRLWSSERCNHYCNSMCRNAKRKF